MQIAQGNKAAGFTPQLYNLKSDIGEKCDVAAANPEIVAQLQKLIAAMKADLGLNDKGPGCRELARKSDATPLIPHDK